MANKIGFENRPGTDRRAEAFVRARLAGRALATYPGEPPKTLEEAYGVQNEAIALWPTSLAGWKVGRITGELEQKFGTDRLSGPIFADRVSRAGSGPANSPVFVGGFAAAEAECILMVREDTPADKLTWSIEEARAFVGAAHLGIEIASSPFQGINEAGPLVTISDFGNNHGLIVGGTLPRWEEYPLIDWAMETLIDGLVVGSATPNSIPGGPLESFRFLLENTAQRGLPLKAGMMISTGAVTGVHEARIGQSATVRMSGLPEISTQLVAFEPAT